MEFRLAEGERIVREYDCATAFLKVGREKQTLKNVLVVTNRRIIHRDVLVGTNTTSISSSEIPVHAVKFVDVFYSNSKKKFEIMALFGWLLLAAGLFCLITSPRVDDAIVPLAISSVCAIMCFVFSAIVNRSLPKAITLSFELGTDVKKNALVKTSAAKKFLINLGASKRPKGSKVVLVSVDEKIATELTQELGAVILDAQNDVCPPADAENN